MVKKGKLKLYTKDNSTSSSHNNSINPYNQYKYWNKNKNIVNDGVVDSQNVKPTQPDLNLGNQSTTPQATQTTQNIPNSQENNQPFTRSFIPKNHIFTPLGESLE